MNCEPADKKILRQQLPSCAVERQKKHKLFAVTFEQKDYFALAHISSHLESIGVECRHVAFGMTTSEHRLAQSFEANYAELLATKGAHVLVCTSEAFNVVCRMKERADFVCISLDHGCAPFKRYSHSAHFLQYDYYLAPTELLSERLKSLFPDRGGRILLGGYPRLEELRESMARKHLEREQLREKYFPGCSNKATKLAMFSWGISETAVQQLPDSEGVVYLFHPATPASLIENRGFGRSQAYLSTPELVSDLFVASDFFFGDISSITLEAAALGLLVCMIVDKNLYWKNYDIDDSFFDPSGDIYLQIPETQHRLEPDRVLFLDDLLKGLSPEYDMPKLTELFSRRRFTGIAVPGMLPPSAYNNVILASSAISKILGAGKQNIAEVAEFTEPAETHWGERTATIINDNDLLQLCYQIALGRQADPNGLATYLPKLQADNSNSAGKIRAVMSILRTMISSPEGQNKIMVPGTFGALVHGILTKQQGK